MKEKLGPILFQFPPFFRATEENIKRLEDFLKFIHKDSAKGSSGFTKPRLTNLQLAKLRFAFEFRHKTWFSHNLYNLLKRYNSAWVIADSPRYPKTEEVTADFIYIRMHGSKVLFSSKYTKKELQDLAQKIRTLSSTGTLAAVHSLKKWQKQGLDIYCYFNNDAQGFAIENAKQLLKLC